MENGNNLSWIMFEGGYIPDQIPSNWKSRALSFELSSGWSSLWGIKAAQAAKYLSDNELRNIIWDPILQSRISNTFASYYGTIYFIICIVLIFFLDNPLLPMTGIFASILTCSPGCFWPYLMPWDLPTMAAWIIIFLIYSRLKNNPLKIYEWLWLGIAISLLGLLKETILVTALFFVGSPFSWPKRMAAIISIVLFSQLLNWVFSGATPDWVFSVNQGSQPGGSRWNPLILWPLLFANVGTVVLLPWLLWKKRDWPLAAVCGTFITLQALNNLACGVYSENRDWLELAPIGWILIAQLFRTSPQPSL